MIALRGQLRPVQLPGELPEHLWRVCDARTFGGLRDSKAAFIVTAGEPAPEGFGLYLRRSRSPAQAPADAPLLELSEDLDHLGPGDIVSVKPTGTYARVLWRARSRLNSILLTERCDHYCLMCSQPPKQGDDGHLLNEAAALIRLLPRSTDGIGITGGEPTLYGGELIRLLSLARNLLPFAGVHVLSNGRRFSDLEFTESWARIDNPRMMVGIPLYGAEPASHDFVVQSRGAFEETVTGILTLGELNQRIELRVVIHRLTAAQLPAIAEFIARNFTFVDQVALMGLEMIGLARANVDQLWIDPVDYQDELREAVALLDRRRIRTLIYNHQLCLLDRSLWPFAVRSISDWKNEYHPECLQCAVRESCGGFFYGAKYGMSTHIRRVEPSEMDVSTSVLAEARVM
jgi:His-Xaa-Ser system radical SAM maturase HxsC